MDLFHAAQFPGSQGSPLDPQALLDDLEWLRRLASRLVNDANHADDLVQDTYAALAEKGPVEVDSRRSYLAGIMRNLLRKSRRDARLRHERERIHDRDVNTEPSADAADAGLERLEVLEITLREARGLPGAQARAVRMHFVDGLSFREIAVQSGLRESTVRGHVSRGLDRLRERLDERFGDRRAWTTPLLPWVAPLQLWTAPSEGGAARRADLEGVRSAGASGGTVGAGGIGAWGVLKLIALAVPLLGALLWIAASHTTERGTAAPLTDADRTTETVLDLGSGDLALATAAARRTPRKVEPPFRPDIGFPGTTPGSAARPPTDRAPHDHRNRPIEGQAVDATNGRPLEGVELWFAFESEGRTKTVDCVTSADGRFSTEPIPASVAEVTLRVLDARHRIHPAPGPATTAEGRIRLPLEEPLRLRVGPTLTLDLRGGIGTDSGWLQASGEAGNVSPRFAVYAEGTGAWARSPVPLDPDMTSLHFVARDGLSVGVGPLPVLVDNRGSATLHCEVRGAVAFAVAASREAEFGRVRLTPVGADVPIATRAFGPHDFGAAIGDAGGSQAVFPVTPAGTYRYEVERSGELVTGEVTVEPGSWSVLRLDDDAPERRDFVARIDASAAPDTPVDQWKVRFAPAAGAGPVQLVSPTRGAGDLWTASVEDQPSHACVATIQPPPDVRLDTYVIEWPGDSSTVRILGPTATTDVRVIAYDAATHELLEGVVLRDARNLELLPTGGSENAGAPLFALYPDTPQSLTIQVAGYRSLAVVWDSERHGPRLEVALTRRPERD